MRDLPAPPAFKERRHFLRRLFAPRSAQMVYVRVDHGLLLRSRVIDLSAAGIRLAHDTEHVLATGGRIRIEQAMTSRLALLKDVQGLIRWVGPQEFGVQFDSILPLQIPDP